MERDTKAKISGDYAWLSGSTLGLREQDQNWRPDVGQRDSQQSMTTGICQNLGLTGRGCGLRSGVESMGPRGAGALVDQVSSSEGPQHPGQGSWLCQSGPQVGLQSVSLARAPGSSKYQL